MQELDYTSLKNKPTKSTKQLIKNALEFGKSIPVRSNPECPPKTMAHYFGNFVAYTEIDDHSKIMGVYYNNKSGEPTLGKQVIFKNDAHVKQRKLGRIIPLTEIFECLAYGIQVKDYSMNHTGWKYYDTYYLYNDVCVVALQKKDAYEVSTVYRTTAASNTGFIDRLPEIVEGLKLKEDSFSRVSIMNRTGELAYKQTKEHREMQLMAIIAHGKFPEPGPSLAEQSANLNARMLLTEEKMKTIRSDPHFEFNFKQAEAAAIMRWAELGCLPHSYPSEHNGQLTAIPLEDFEAQPHQEYIVVFKFEGSKKKTIFNKQKHFLKKYGLDMDRYPYELQWTQENIAVLGFNMNIFSANDQPWSHRR